MSEETNREVLISLKHVEISFDNGGKQKFKAVQDATFDIYKGETFALVGESGSGKTTIGRAIMRINELSDGEILFQGKRISGKLSKQEDTDVIRNIQMIFQDPAASLNERATIEYIISEGLYNFHLYKNEEDRLAKVDRALEEVGLLPEHKSRYPHEFSGGQRQRLTVARALVGSPDILVLDDSASALDYGTDAAMRKALSSLPQKPARIIVSQRTVSLADCNRILVLDDGNAAGTTLKNAIATACNKDFVRPLTDIVSVKDPDTYTFNVNVTYYISNESTTPLTDIQAAVTRAVNEYVTWQRGRLGRDINPSKLWQLLMQTGIKRAVISAPTFHAMSDGADGSTPELAVLGTKTITNGGYEDE